MIGLGLALSIGATQPPAPLTITGVFIAGAKQYLIRFSGPITYDGSGSLDHFDIDGDTVIAASASGTDLTVTLGVVNGGSVWTLSAQPSQIAQKITTPETGSTSA